MLTEQETADMCAMVDDMESLVAKGGPGSAAAYLHLRLLATTTGDEWDALVRRYLEQRSQK